MVLGFIKLHLAAALCSGSCFIKLKTGAWINKKNPFRKQWPRLQSSVVTLRTVLSGFRRACYSINNQGLQNPGLKIRSSGGEATNEPKKYLLPRNRKLRARPLLKLWAFNVLEGLSFLGTKRFTGLWWAVTTMRTMVAEKSILSLDFHQRRAWGWAGGSTTSWGGCQKGPRPASVGCPVIFRVNTTGWPMTQLSSATMWVWKINLSLKWAGLLIPEQRPMFTGWDGDWGQKPPCPQNSRDD